MRKHPPPMMGLCKGWMQGGVEYWGHSVQPQQSYQSRVKLLELQSCAKCSFPRCNWLFLFFSLVCSRLWWSHESSVYQHEWEGIHRLFTGSGGVLVKPLCHFPMSGWLRKALVFRDGISICTFFQDSPPGWSLPIQAMIKSLPLWSILIFYFTDYWYYYIITSYTPTYISSVLEVNIRDVSKEKTHSVLLLLQMQFSISPLFMVLGQGSS